MNVKLGFVGLILFENVANSCNQHSRDGDDGFLVTSALFNR